MKTQLLKKFDRPLKNSPGYSMGGGIVGDPWPMTAFMTPSRAKRP